jgi:hypothetical protein
MNDSFKIAQNEDGSYTATWDPQDQKWKWLNGKTAEEIRAIIQEAIREDLNDR